MKLAMRILEQQKADQDSSDEDAGPPKFEKLSKAE